VKRLKTLLYLFCLFNCSAYAQSNIKGRVLENQSNQPIEKAKVKNVHQNLWVLTDHNGEFIIDARGNELLEFQSPDYKKVRLRIVSEQPSRYIIHLEKQENIRVSQMEENSYKSDSLTYDASYFSEMNGARDGEGNTCPGTSTETKRKHWAFPAIYKKGQSEKYIDFVFTKDVVTKLTNLQDKDLNRFMKNYRPTEKFLRSLTEYEFLEYIKKSYREFSLEKGY